jgi:hypothetical protein
MELYSKCCLITNTFCLLLQYRHCGINCSTTSTLHKSIELSLFSPKDCIFLASIMLPFGFYYVGEHHKELGIICI